jgi:hypothetical protein
VNDDLLLLMRFGRDLDFRSHSLEARRTRAKRNSRGEDSQEDPIAPTIRDWLIEKHLKIRDKRGALVPLRLNKAQSEYSNKCTQRNIVLKARQLGITTYVAARFFIETVTRPGTLTMQVAHTQESAEEIFRMVHRFWENLPEGVRHGALIKSRSNIRQIVFPRLDSEYRVATAADENAGRGLTIQNLHCSEVARWPRYAAETLAALRAAVPSHGTVVLESTPNGAGGLFYEEWQMAEETGYTKHFFPWWYEASYKSHSKRLMQAPLTDGERELVKRWQLTVPQIAFRRSMWATMRGLAPQEFAEDDVACFKASGECVFDLEAIEKRLGATVEAFQAQDNGRLKIWFPPQPEKEYIVGVDPAGGGSDGDYACAEVIEITSGVQCAELHGHFPPRELAKKVVELARQYGDALVAVERNNHGYGVLAHLRTSEAYSNIYAEGHKEGWLTSAVSRPRMIENLAAILMTAPEIFNSQRLLSELRTFVRHADGSSCASSGAHDDSVMAMAIAMAVRKATAGSSWRREKMELAALGVRC